MNLKPEKIQASTSIGEIMSVRSRRGLNFFRLSVHNCFSCVHNCDDQLYLPIVSERNQLLRSPKAFTIYGHHDENNNNKKILS